MSKYKAIQFYDETKSWPVEWMCKGLEVSRAGYYKWLKHETTEEENENEIIAQLIQEYDERYKHTLGYRRMTGYINRLNHKQYGEKRIHRLMRMLGIHSVIRPKKKKYQHSTPEAVADNMLKRDFNASRPNEKWATDVTEFKGDEGAVVHKLYLIQDVLGYSPTVSGLVMIPSAIVMGAMSPLTGKFFDKHGIRFLGIFGMSVLTVASFCLSCLTEQSPLYLLIIFLCVRNFGGSFVLSNVNTWGINDLPQDLLAHGNAVSGTFRQIAMSFGAAISTSVYTFVANNLPGGIADPSAGIIGINASFGYQAVLCLIGLVICIF